ncbi:hypothetical protein PV327_002220 [Microctonus hyperodae]|uniref:Uridine 5'-monophosphate synthase n=1 Tax=Microctonus hyperodae TaxID=165561 RepID=A0AA39KP10_MICHY|nr:hypothetical protein PV327_002220 [Microctonus hyperodae]
MEKQLEELAIILYEINAIKFGDFVTKVGLKTPVYIDLRTIISHPQIFRQLSTILWTLHDVSEHVDQICGVPYTALPIASLISVESNIPMVIRRKEAKSYGTKKLIEGKYKAGEKCIIIEDVITSGSSILEVVNDLKQEGLVITEALVIMDREQGGRKNIENSGIKVKSLYTLTQLLHYLLAAGKITPVIVQNVENYLATCNTAPLKLLNESTNERLKMDFSSRVKMAKNQLASKILRLMDTKESMICLAADLSKTDSILELAEIAGPHIVILKIHVDIIENFNEEFIKQLKDLSLKHKFFIMEDRKFADIGNTVSLQYSKGIYKIAEWADLITVHSVSGPGIFDGLRKALKNIPEDRGIFVVSEMSSEGTLTTGNYITDSLKMSATCDLVAGHVCQSNIFSDPGLIQLTPGVKLAKASDDLGQQYNTPESVVNAGADLAVVGRGITDASDKLAAILKYKDQLWSAYRARISH